MKSCVALLSITNKLSIMKKLIILTVFIIIIGIGCTPVYYRPNTQSVPLLTKKGEVNLSGSIETNGGTGQAAVAVNDYLGVLLNYSNFNVESGNINGDGNIYEVGAGYYSKFENRGIYEAYGLAGLGNVQNQYTGDEEFSSFTVGSVKSKFSRISFQQNIGLRFKYFEAAISTRLARLDYYDFEGDMNFNEMNQAEYLKVNSINYLFEPAITLKAGIKNVKLQLQIQRSVNLTNQLFYQDDIGMSLGLSVNFNQ